VILKPPFCRLAAMPAPMVPRPMNPTRIVSLLIG
jgi:hypothetical protein